jgi:hypothetical protein
MAQNYRNPSGRPDFGREGRYPTGSDRDRYRPGDEQRFSPSWDERDSARGYEGDRSYGAGGYPEEFGYRGGRNRDEQERDYSSVYGRGRGSRYDEARFDEANRWSSGEGRNEDERFSPYERNQGTTSSSWREDQGDRGGYFGTGSYTDDGGASRGFGADFERARAETQRRYGRDRDAQRQPWRGQRGGYEERSSWGYGQQQPSHRGRGPQGYQRSDERLKEMICERLTDDPAIDASNVTIDVTSQVVKLTGTVDDRSTKYEIEELIESFGGVKDIDNQLRVQPSPSNWSSTNQTQGAGQQLRGGSDWEAGSSSVSTSGAAGRSGTGTSPNKRN